MWSTLQIHDPSKPGEGVFSTQFYEIIGISLSLLEAWSL